MEGPTQNGDNLVVYYNFNTAWGLAMPALINLSSQYPDLLLTLSYEEETGWGGELEILRGELISDESYDNSDQAENFVNDLLIADTFDQYLSDNPPAQITDDGFGNPVVVEEDN